MCSDALKDVAQIFEGIDAQEFAGGRQTGQDCRRVAAVVAAIKNPVLPSNRNSAQAAFRA
jgi:hypothetical protein